VPTVGDVYLDRAAIIAELTQFVAALIVNYGASDEAVVQVLFGDAEPQGRLPFDIHSSMDAVLASRSDVPIRHREADVPLRVRPDVLLRRQPARVRMHGRGAWTAVSLPPGKKPTIEVTTHSFDMMNYRSAPAHRAAAHRPGPATAT
jgi:hypothetical protein